MSTAVSTDTPRIYVACLAAYNNGTLHGEWITLEAGITADEIHEKITAILESSPEHDPHGLYGPAEEWAIHDHDNFGGYSVSEYEQIEKVVAVAEAINEHRGAFLAWLNDEFDPDIDDYEPKKLVGEYDSRRDWAEQSTESLHDFMQVAARAWAKTAPAPEEHVDWHTTAPCIVKLDLDELIMHAQGSWGYRFCEYGGKTYVFTN
ncbi:antirestriction protein ArdA [Rhodococcoides fascians]|uniref:antirestriction protein ArdA n=1 Tax=Rhodococcoides fascians TaxID=1828 RepID=UPI000691A185|nr:antirestriction protein ArdA [Rhodococcus fascians]